MDLEIYKNLMTAVYFRDDVDFRCMMMSKNLSLHMSPHDDDDRKRRKVNNTATPQKTVVGSCIIKKEKAEEFGAESLASRTRVDEIGERKSSVVCPVVVKKAKTVTLKSEHKETKGKGRKLKRVPTGCCTAKKQKIDDEEVVKNMEQKETYILFSSLPSCPDSVKIHHNEIKSDISKHDQDGFYYKQAMNVQVDYTVDQEKRSIRLDHLLQR